MSTAEGSDGFAVCGACTEVMRQRIEDTNLLLPMSVVFRIQPAIGHEPEVPHCGAPDHSPHLKVMPAMIGRRSV